MRFSSLSGLGAVVVSLGAYSGCGGSDEESTGSGGATDESGGAGGEGAAQSGGRVGSGGGTASGGALGGEGGESPLGSGGKAGTGGGEQAQSCPTESVKARICESLEDCEDSQICLKGACIQTCGADLSELDATLGDAFTPIASFCGTRARHAYAAVTFENDCETWSYFGLGTSGSLESNSISIVNRHYELIPPNPNIVIKERGFTEHIPTWEGLSFWSAGALSLDFATLIFGMNNNDNTEAQLLALPTSSSELVVGPELRASGLAFLDADTVLVGAGNLGLLGLSYPWTPTSPTTQVAIGFSSGSGTVGVLSELGYVMIHDFGGITAFVRATRIAGAAAGTAPVVNLLSEADMVKLSGFSEVELLGEDYLLRDADGSGTDRLLLPISLVDGHISFGAGVPFAQTNLVEHIVYLGDGRVLLNHFGGSIYGELN